MSLRAEETSGESGISRVPSRPGELDVIFLVLRSGPPSRRSALRSALIAQGMTIATEHELAIGGTDCVLALARAVAGYRNPLSGDALPGGELGSNAVPTRPVVLVPVDLVISPGAFGALLDDPRVRTGGLVTRTGQSAREFLDVLVIDAVDRPVAAGLVHDLDPDRPDQILLDLVRGLPEAGISVRPVPLAGYLWARPVDRESSGRAEQALLEVPERRVRLRAAVRSREGLYASLVLRRLSWRLTGLVERLGLTDNQVAVVAFALGLVAVALIGHGARPAVVAGALLLQVGLVLDRVSSELARYRRRSSPFGVWLQSGGARIVEFFFVYALAVAGARAGQDLWAWAAAAIILLTLHDLLGQSWRLRSRVPGTQRAPAPWVAPGGREHGPAPWVRPTRSRMLYGFARFPMTERVLVIGLSAAVWNPRGTLILLCALLSVTTGCLLAWTLHSGARQLRRSAVPARPAADTGPWIEALLTRVHGRGEPVAAPLVAAAEAVLAYLLAVTAGAHHGAAVMFVAVLGLIHHLYAVGLRVGGHGGSGPLVIGTDLRIVGFVLLIVLPGRLLPGTASPEWVTGGLWALTAVVAVISAVTGLAGWRTAGRGVPTGGPADTP